MSIMLLKDNFLYKKLSLIGVILFFFPFDTTFFLIRYCEDEENIAQLK